MFKVVPNRTFTHVVTVMMPIDGGHSAETLKVTYNSLETEEAKKFDLKSPDGSTEFMKRVIAKLDDVTDAEGKPLPYSDALRDQVIRMPNARNAIVNGYFAAIAKAAEGN